MKLNVGAFLLVMGFGVLVQGVFGHAFDFPGTYTLGIAIISLGAGLIQ